MPELEGPDDVVEDDDEWEECPDEEMDIPCTCLFCSDSFPSPEETFAHCKSTHGFDIGHVRTIHSLDCFGFIKLINYSRIKVIITSATLINFNITIILWYL